MKKRFLIASLMVLLSVALLSCGGGGSVGGGAEVFKTVTLEAVSGFNLVDSDVATHTDIDACGTATDDISYSQNDVDVQFISTINPGLPASITGSDVRLESVTVKYKPANADSPALPSQKYALSAIVPANSDSLTVPIRVASGIMKATPPLSDLICNAPTTYIYFVTLEFKGTEIDTDKTASFETNLTVNFSDFVDQ